MNAFALFPLKKFLFKITSIVGSGRPSALHVNVTFCPSSTAMSWLVWKSIISGGTTTAKYPNALFIGSVLIWHCEKIWSGCKSNVISKNEIAKLFAWLRLNLPYTIPGQIVWCRVFEVAIYDFRYVPHWFSDFWWLYNLQSLKLFEYQRVAKQPIQITSNELNKCINMFNCCSQRDSNDICRKKDNSTMHHYQCSDAFPIINLLYSNKVNYEEHCRTP